MSFQWCVVLDPSNKQGVQTKGVARLDSLWSRGDVISISFLDGDPGLCSRVKHVADSWLERTRARLTFEWRVTGPTDIRVSFSRAGSWSLLGRRCRDLTDQTQPTMNFGWLKADSTDVEVREVVLHEFGHALGLLHEHQNPEAEIPWDREAVIRELKGPPNNWDEATIEHNVLQGYDTSQVTSTPFDDMSIMLYPISASWTHGGYSTANNSDLSPGDVALVRTLYGG